MESSHTIIFKTAQTASFKTSPWRRSRKLINNVANIFGVESDVSCEGKMDDVPIIPLYSSAFRSSHPNFGKFFLHLNWIRSLYSITHESNFSGYETKPFKFWMCLDPFIRVSNNNLKWVDVTMTIITANYDDGIIVFKTPQLRHRHDDGHKNN